MNRIFLYVKFIENPVFPSEIRGFLLPITYRPCGLGGIQVLSAVNRDHTSMKRFALSLLHTVPVAGLSRSGCIGGIHYIFYGLAHTLLAEF